VFSQIARESLLAAQQSGASTILDSPTGHIRDFREQLCNESARWIGAPYLGHPTETMVQRVEDEYRLAHRIRVSSAWARRSLVARGVDDRKIFVVPQPIDLLRFAPPSAAEPVRTGPLTLVFVGTFSLAKGFQYLLRAIARLGSRHFRLRMIGGTGDPWCRRLLERLTAGLDVSHAPGDPRAAYASSELFVLPSLHDGFGLVVAEAMACGLPAITTDACGASEWIEHDTSGWVLPRGDEDALAITLDRALAQRARLPEMGEVARKSIERLTESVVARSLRQHVSESWNLGESRSLTA
jgi:glycosyltransferase involved in cell wall biosynthesis